MNDAGTVSQCYVCVTGYIVRLLRRMHEIKQRLILLKLQIFAGKTLQYSVFTVQNRITQSFRKIVRIISVFHLYVGLVRIHTERHVGGKRPRCCRPCQNVGILALYLESGDSRAFFHVLISLGHLVAGKRRSASRTVRNDLKSLVEKPLFPDLLESPPLGLDIVILIGNVRIIHIRPEADSLGEIFPHALVLPYAFLTVLDKRLKTVFLDLLLAVQSQHLLHFQLNRESMGIPAGLSRHVAPLHGAVSRNHILDHTGKDMADMRFSVGGRRTVIKCVGFSLFSVINALLENIVIFPEFFNFFFSRYKIQVCRNFVIHLF